MTGDGDGRVDHAFDTWCRPQLQLNAVCVCCMFDQVCGSDHGGALYGCVWGNYNTVLYIHIVCAFVCVRYI